MFCRSKQNNFMSTSCKNRLIHRNQPTIPCQVLAYKIEENIELSHIHLAVLLGKFSLFFTYMYRMISKISTSKNMNKALKFIRTVLIHNRNLRVCNRQSFDPSLLSYKCWLIFIGMKKFFFFWKNKFKKANSKKTKLRFSTIPILNIFCDVGCNLKKGIKMIFFCVFSPFWSSRWTALWPYKLSHIDTICINLSY